MGRVVHFELPAKDPDKAISFYKKVFGWKAEQWGKEEYWMITTGKKGEGINGGIVHKASTGVLEKPTKVKDAAHAVNATITVDVDDVDESIKKIKKNGGHIVMDKSPVQGVGWMAYFSDPDGNLLGVMQMDKNAR